MSLEELYQEVILDHFRHPRCHGCVAHAPLQSTLYNPMCGDQINVSAQIEGGKLAHAGFSGHGCSISQASASMMLAVCKDRPIEEVRAIAESFKQMMRGEKRAEDLPELGDAAALEGVRKFSARVKCALLAWEALEKCLAQSEAKPVE